MLKLKFNFHDVFRAPRLAFSLQRMWIQLAGLFFGYLGYLVFTYVSFLLNGFPFQTAWAQYGLFPCIFMTGEVFPWYGLVLGIIGIAILVVAMLITNTAVARAVYMSAKGNTFYTWRESFAFAFRKIGSVLLTPISLAVLIGLLVLGALVIGLLGKIPFIGEIGVSLFTVIWFLAALFLFFVGIVAVITLFYAPPILATTDEDAFEAVFQTFSITWSQPWRLVFYQAITVVLSVLAMGIFAFFAKEAIMIMNGLFASFMGSDFINLANNGQAMLQNWTLMAEQAVELLYRGYDELVFFSREFLMVSDVAVSVVISSYLYALSLLFIGGWVLSYGLSTFTAGNTLAYIVMRQKKDEENLLERVDKEEEEESDDEESSEETDESSESGQEDENEENKEKE